MRDGYYGMLWQGAAVMMILKLALEEDQANHLPRFRRSSRGKDYVRCRPTQLHWVQVMRRPSIVRYAEFTLAHTTATDIQHPLRRELLSARLAQAASGGTAVLVASDHASPPSQAVWAGEWGKNQSTYLQFLLGSLLHTMSYECRPTLITHAPVGKAMTKANEIRIQSQLAL